MADTMELYATPTWAALSGQATVKTPGDPIVVGGPGLPIVLVSNVTAPVRAKALPFNAAPVVRVTEAWAMMVPLKMEFVPRVAELPTCQKMLAACAPFWRITWLPLNVVSALAIWKIKTLFVLPWPSRWRGPVRFRKEVEVYNPGVRVSPPRSPDTLAPPVRPAASV